MSGKQGDKMQSGGSRPNRQTTAHRKEQREDRHQKKRRIGPQEARKEVKQQQELISGCSDDMLRPFNPDEKESSMLDVVTRIDQSMNWEEVLVQPVEKEKILITCDEVATEGFEKRWIAAMAKNQEQNSAYYAFRVRWQ